MTAKTLEEEAREAAERWYPPGAGRLGGKLYAGKPAKEGFRERSSFQHGYLAAATLRDKEIEELRARDVLWGEYVTLLATELQGLVGLAVAHGWPGNQANYEKGKKLRTALGIEPIPLPGEGG